MSFRNRCLWGNDWTRAFAVVNYEQAVTPFLKTNRLSNTERAMLMGGATARAYGWSPKKAWRRIIHLFPIACRKTTTAGGVLKTELRKRVLRPETT